MLDLLRAKMPWPDVFFKDFIPSGFVALSNIFFVLGLAESAVAYYCIKR